MYNECSFSNHDMLNDLSIQQLQQCLYVECPECGSIRKIDLYSQYFPAHPRLDGTARRRAQWWERKDEKWQLQEK